MNTNGRDPVGVAARNHPELARAISRLSPQDMAKLREVLSDPEKTRQVLSTPLAQQMLCRINSADAKDKS